jgi:hypothetical protein
MWEQMKAAEAEGEALDAKVRAAARAFRRRTPRHQMLNETRKVGRLS